MSFSKLMLYSSQIVFCVIKSNIIVFPTIVSVIYVDFSVTWLLSLVNPNFFIPKHNRSSCFSVLFHL